MHKVPDDTGTSLCVLEVNELEVAVENVGGVDPPLLLAVQRLCISIAQLVSDPMINGVAISFFFELPQQGQQIDEVFVG
jgi:hypothetical protein